jgi:hypothetical protein
MARKKAGGAWTYDAASIRYINPAQAGGIETSVLDDGAGRLTRIAWVNTGSPLRYKVVIDRGLDIADAFFGQHCLAYLSLTGTTPPNRAMDRGAEWLKGFFAGLLTSCGPQHVGGPATIEGVEYGIHGTHSNTPAAVEAICQPDPAAGIQEMSITGLVRTARMFGPNVQLRRTIRSVLGAPAIHIHDSFLNRGNTAVRHCWMLHFNLGWPLLDAGAKVVYRGQLWPRKGCQKWFSDPARYKIVQRPTQLHRGSGEDVAFIDPPTDDDGNCHVGLANEPLGLAVELVYPHSQFPRLVNWQHLGPGGEYVMGLEPLSGGMDAPGAPAGELAPGQTRQYDCTLKVLGRPEEIQRFVRNWG